MTLKKQILVVEDNELNREILCTILSEEYEVLQAENGLEGLEVLQKYKDSIALILLDVMMPVMDGHTFLDRVREDAELSLIPVIVTTQSDSETDELSALSHGATDFVPKPYRPQVILRRVANLIRLRETAAMINQLQYDRLTGLYTKEFFFRKVRERLLEDPDEDYCIVCSNIENFKLVNDAFGVREGDRLLREVAEVARAMVGDSGFCGRFSADRFLCLQKRSQEQKDRMNFGSVKVPGQELSPLLKTVVMRWGIYEITDRSIPVEQMCDRALLAAGSIKGQYGRFFAIYDDSLRNQLLREQTITEAMLPALQQGQFVVYLQPKYSLKDERMAGAEALVRWIHPEWGFMSPGEFIPLFEKNGFIPQLDQVVWEQVCMLLRSWKEQGIPLIPVSVNVSRADIYQLDLVETFRALTEKYGVEPAYLHLEITESIYGENQSALIQTVRELRGRGFIIEMDDFGSGYSSLSMLGRMKLDVLKLDMKFIQTEIVKPADQSILNDVIAMAHRMRLSVVAEGVETREQVNRLWALGCDYVQGYFFAKPMPSAEFEALLRKQSPEDILSRPAVWPEEELLHGVLVADTDADYRAKVRQAFEGEYRILEAADQESALACIRSGKVSAVILSMELPDGGAAEMLKTLRQDPAYWKVPVLATLPGGDQVAELALETDDFLCKCHPVFDLRRRVQRLMDIVAFRERESALLDEAGRDPLTGLYNRRGLQAAMAALRAEDLPLAVYLFDLDDLKRINDTGGHDMGDQMIRSFANLLCCNTRHGDILCRYGGDEFVVILKHVCDAESMVRKGGEICRLFREHFTAEGIPAACSAGMAFCGAEDKPSERLIDLADQALYRAKRENKGGCCLWQEPSED